MAGERLSAIPSPVPVANFVSCAAGNQLRDQSFTRSLAVYNADGSQGLKVTGELDGIMSLVLSPGTS